MRLFRTALLAATALAATALDAVAQLQLENGDRNTLSYVGPPVPPSLAIDPRVPTPGQWQNGTAFSGWQTQRLRAFQNLQSKIQLGTIQAGRTRNTEGPLTPNQFRVPSYTAYQDDGTTVDPAKSYSMRSLTLARPLSLRVSTLAMGAVIARPDVQPDGSPATADFYLAEPQNSATGRFYWSPHAQKVFATEPGVITVDWEERTSGNTFTQTYVVSGSPARPTKRIYWTEKSFNGPLVRIPDGRVADVHIVYNDSLFPREVADGEDYETANGITPLTPVEKRTLWFNSQTGFIQAYNREGRVFVEYLGDLRDQILGLREHLGFEIIDVIKEVRPDEMEVAIGDPVGPSDGDPDLEASVAAGITGGADPYLYKHLSLGGTKTTYFAVKETTPIVVSDRNEDGTLDELDEQQSNEVLIYWLEEGIMGIRWPKLYVGYIFKWPEELFVAGTPTETDIATYYSIYARPEDPADAFATGVQFDSTNNPVITYQDDPTRQHAQLTPQGIFYTNVDSSNPDGRTLVRYTDGEEIWFERVYSQLNTAFDSYAATPVNADVGFRIVAPNDTDSLVGYIRPTSGNAYHPGAYKNPFEVGFETAATGAIIPVNALPGNDGLEVWWYASNAPPSDTFSPTLWPSRVVRYQLRWPSSPNEIVLASNAGSGDLGIAASGTIYRQPDSSLPGYNPNEEHALMSGGVAWALRDDLNDPATSSDAFVLVDYVAEDGRPAVAAYKVLRENTTFTFDYAATVGAILQAPMPLPFLAPPIADDGTLANYEVNSTDDVPTNQVTAPSYYDKFTWDDRKGSTWVYRGTHRNADDGTLSFRMRYFYKTAPEFDFPSDIAAPPVGSIVPYLSAASSPPAPGDDITAVTPLNINFNPVWPTNPPILNIGETLALPKRGLPAVRGQSSAELIYQQSFANDDDGETTSARLFDPTRAKTYHMGSGTLDAVPGSVVTQDVLGKLFFPNLPPHLVERFYFDPTIGGAGALVFVGEFQDELFGEKYYLLNVLSQKDVDDLKALDSSGDSTGWNSAIDNLSTTVETFIEDPDRAGSYIVETTDNFGPQEIAEIYSADAAVDSYALNASGGGTGFVVLATGNGRAFTPDGDPVSLHVFKVQDPLYRGELKVITSANPLDEKLTLQHTGDFAGKPEDYQFAWLSAPPVAGLAPSIYQFSHLPVLSDGSWDLLNNPPSDFSKFRAFGADLSLDPWTDAGNLAANQIVIDDGAGTIDHGDTLPNALLRRTFSFAGSTPIALTLSIDIDDNDGAVVYLNDARIAVWNVPGLENSVPTTAPGLPGFMPLDLAFDIDPATLLDDNTVTVELYTDNDAGTLTSFNLRLEGTTETEDLSAWSNEVTVDAKNPAQDASEGVGKNRHTVEGASILTLTDNYFTMRYRALPGTEASAATGGGWSRWMNPQLAEGWIKRALAGINPFDQRVTDLLNNAVNTDVSLLTQAGKRWEGDVALNLDNIDDFGLIEIYETILNRGKSLSISGNPPLNVPSANDALLLAAGYLNDLYMIHGNEAFADAANPTIAFDTAEGQSGDISTALFAFKGQLATVLDEELTLLRGRDDSLAPGNTVAPVYNRLVWNYTRGINGGEAIYALNYNIRDLDGSGAADASDAAVAFPQGHGDAYGHYLTALKGYYTLFANPNFAWTPRIEAVLVLGQPVSVDYQDERKFAAAAAALGRTASQVLDLTYRQQFTADTSAGWSHLRDGRTNLNTGVTRRWGTDEWACRAGQGALFHWVTANSVLPETDPDPSHEGIQKVDRTTVPELDELVAHATRIQQTADNADAHLNPLGLTRNAVSFDISPAAIDEGQTHFEQIFDRAVAALENAAFAFDNAKGSTAFLRSQETSLTEQVNAIREQEVAFENELIEIYGTPYTDDIGPGKTYPQGYEGPDLVHPLYIDVPEIFFDPAVGSVDPSASPDSYYTVTVPYDFSLEFYLDNIAELVALETSNVDPNTGGITVASDLTYVVNSVGEVVKPGTWTGRRLSPGRIQTSASDLLAARHRLRQTVDDYESEIAVLGAQIDAYNQIVTSRYEIVSKIATFNAEAEALEDQIATLRDGARVSTAASEIAIKIAEAAAEGLPQEVGTSNDATSIPRSLALIVGITAGEAFNILSVAYENSADRSEFDLEQLSRLLDVDTEEFEWQAENAQLIADLKSGLSDVQGLRYAIDQAIRDVDQAKRDLQTAQIDGITVLKLRETFRKRTAGTIHGFRTRDLAFRVFRDESLEKYQALFDLAARYTFLAAKAYDYETGLLDGSGSNAAKFFDGIVQSRALGVVQDGQPQFTSSNTGDPGLAGVLAQMAGDWSVVRSRLGFNNEDRDRTVFSLREENFRIIPGTGGDTAWRDMLDAARLPDLSADPDVRRFAMQLADPDALAVPGIVVEFQTTIEPGKNFFGKPLAGGDHNFSPSTFATKIRAAGIAFDGYIGMDSPTLTGGFIDDIDGNSPTDPNLGFLDPNALSATPYIYLIPAGADLMRSPPLGDQSTIRSWTVEDQAVPLPFNIGNSDFSTRPAWVSAESLSEPAFTLRKHQAFRAVPGDTIFGSQFGSDNAFTSSRLIGRSVWNTRWKLVVPGDTLLNNPERGLDLFTEQVRDIQLYLETYSYSGN